MLQRGRTTGSPWPATSKNTVRSYLLEPKYIRQLVVKGQGDSRGKFTRTEVKDLNRAAKVHYFPKEPASRLIDMKLDIKKRIEHSQRVFNPTKKIDNDAPRLYPRIPRTERAAYRLDDIMLENKKLLERICTIWRTKGMVDTSAPTVEWKSNYRQRMWDMVKREADNVALLYFIQTATAQVPTRDDCARDFSKAVEKMRFVCRYPLLFLKDSGRDMPLPMPEPPPLDPEAPRRKRVYMEFITSQERLLGRIELELFEDQAPQTVANFLAHIRGEAPRPAAEGDGEGGEDAVDAPRTYSYRDTPLHRILPGYYCLGGDVVNRNGSAGSSIHGGAPFPDEKNDLTHCEPGLLCTIGAKADSNDSKFMLTMKALPTLDDKSTVFGRVVKGFEVLLAINSLGAKASGKPVVQVYCCDCGDVARDERPAGKRRRRPRRRSEAAVNGAASTTTAPTTAAAPQRRAKQPRATTRHHFKAASRSFSSTRISVSSGGGGPHQAQSPYASPRRTPRATPRRT